MFFFFFKQKTAYEIGTGDWSSDVCSSDLQLFLLLQRQAIYVEKLDVEAGEKVVFDEVILVGGESTKVGAPTDRKSVV